MLLLLSAHFPDLCKESKDIFIEKAGAKPPPLLLIIFYACSLFFKP